MHHAHQRCLYPEFAQRVLHCHDLQFIAVLLMCSVLAENCVQQYLGSGALLFLLSILISAILASANTMVRASALSVLRQASAMLLAATPYTSITMPICDSLRRCTYNTAADHSAAEQPEEPSTITQDTIDFGVWAYVTIACCWCMLPQPRNHTQPHYHRVHDSSPPAKAAACRPGV